MIIPQSVINAGLFSEPIIFYNFYRLERSVLDANFSVTEKSESAPELI